MENIRKPRHNFVLNDNPMSFCRCEFAIVEALHVLGLSLHVPAIEQYFLSLISGDSPQPVPGKACFASSSEKLSACIYQEKSGFKMHVLLYAHLVTTRWFEAKALFL